MKTFKNFRVLRVGEIMRATDLLNSKGNQICKPVHHKGGWANVGPWTGRKVEKRYKRNLWIVRKVK